MKNLIQSKNTYLILLINLIIFLFVLSSYKGLDIEQKNSEIIVPAADQINTYISLLKGKRIAVVANQTSVVSQNPHASENQSFIHLIDTLLQHHINIIKVFAPEHGFRGKVDAGEHVANDKDKKTGLPLISLYGKNRKPSVEQLKGIDLLVFDIQDVGVRFYTYISTLTYVMEACAEQGIPVMILDRPNPNAHYIDGPMLDLQHKSFVGMHPVPLVYGMTIGEYGQMVNGENWLDDGKQCDLHIIRLKNYTHDKAYSLRIRPSPNLPNDHAINLYPSLGFFEGTIINAGRGTEFQFQRYGAPFFPETDFTYTPEPNFGAKHPKFNGESCYGVDLRNLERLNIVNLEWLIDAFHKTPDKKDFFGKTFTVHAGNENLQKQIESGMTADKIRATWQKDIKAFNKIRSKYLLYP